MFLKIGSQLTGMDNSVCNKGVYELLFLFYLLSSFKKVGNLYYLFQGKEKESITTLSYNALGIRKRDCSRPTFYIKKKSHDNGF